MHDARQIANEVLNRAWEQDLEITQLQINKIVYFLHGHHLRDFDVPLVKSEFQAWQRGPVHTALRAAFNRFGREPITDPALKLNPVTREQTRFPPITDNQAIKTIETWLDPYLAMTTGALVDKTHAPGSPWSETMRLAKTSVNLGMKIPDDIIRDRFEGFKRT
ncbi:MAG: DUF4065 domain-containing protein [Rhodobacteraceae bacterium]|nr:DUF4065 domain-containing protein [Paracoccaceae bacterium]